MNEITITGFGSDSEDFFEKIRKIINEESIKGVANESDTPEKERYLSRKQTADELKISLTTLWDYTRHGLIKSVRIGSKVLYRWSDIENALTDIEQKKWR